MLLCVLCSTDPSAAAVRDVYFTVLIVFLAMVLHQQQPLTLSFLLSTPALTSHHALIPLFPLSVYLQVDLTCNLQVAAPYAHICEAMRDASETSMKVGTVYVNYSLTLRGPCVCVSVCVRWCTDVKVTECVSGGCLKCQGKHIHQ